MSRSALRIGLIIFTSITLAVHLYLGVNSLFFARFGPRPGGAGGPPPGANAQATPGAGSVPGSEQQSGTPGPGRQGGFGGPRGGFGFDFLGIAWLLNAIGYSALLTVNLANVPYFKNHRKLAAYLLAGFAVVTIVAWVFIGGALRPNGLARQNPLAIPDKIDEILLVVAAVWYARGA